MIYLFLLRLIKFSYRNFFRYFINDPIYNYDNILNTVNGVEIFLMSLVSFLLLKNKYHIHHYISMVIYCILGIISDIILGSYNKVSFKYIYVYIIYILNDAFIFCYVKYMMDKLYYHYIEVVLSWAIIGLLVKFIIYTILITYEHVNNISGFLDEIYTYLKETKAVVIIFYQFFYIPIDAFSFYFLVILLLYYLQPNHMIVTDEINVYLGLIFFEDNHNKYYTLIPLAIQLFILLFFFEILEFNYCGLNTNTNKRVRNREMSEMEMEKKIDNIIELEEYYLKPNQFEEQHDN